MKTKVLKIHDEAGLEEAASEAAEVLLSGGLVAFPTETVYGLAAISTDENAVAEMYSVKERPRDKAITLQIADAARIQQIAVMTPVSELLAALFFPGPLTMVLPRKRSVPDFITSGKNSVGVRIPDHRTALAVLRKTGVPLAVTSANISGGDNLVDARAVEKALGGKIPLILDDGICPGGQASTVADCRAEAPRILRHGAITAEMLEMAIKQNKHLY